MRSALQSSAAIGIACLPRRVQYVASGVILIVCAPFVSMGLQRMIPAIEAPAFTSSPCASQNLQALLPNDEPVARAASPDSFGADPGRLIVNDGVVAGSPAFTQAALLRAARTGDMSLPAALGFGCAYWRDGIVSSLPRSFEPGVGARYAAFERRQSALQRRFSVARAAQVYRPAASLENIGAADALMRFFADGSLPPGMALPFTSSIEGNNLHSSWVSGQTLVLVRAPAHERLLRTSHNRVTRSANGCGSPQLPQRVRADCRHACSNQCGPRNAAAGEALRILPVVEVDRHFERFTVAFGRRRRSGRRPNYRIEQRWLAPCGANGWNSVAHGSRKRRSDSAVARSAGNSAVAIAARTGVCAHIRCRLGVVGRLAFRACTSRTRDLQRLAGSPELAPQDRLFVFLAADRCHVAQRSRNLVASGGLAGCDRDGAVAPKARIVKIGLLANTFEPTYALKAGGHVHFIEVARRWREHELVIFGPKAARESFLSALPRAQYVAMPSLLRAGPYAKLDFVLRAILGILRRRQLRSCDVLLCTSHFIADVLPAVMSKPRRAAAIIWHVIDAPWKRPRGMGWNNSLAYVSERFALLLIRSLFGANIVGTMWLARRLRLDGRRAPIFVTTNGVDVPGGGAGEVRVSIARKDAVFLGRLHPAKGVEHLIDAWARLPAACGGSRLFLAGPVDYNYSRVLSKAIFERGLSERIEICGEVDEQTKWQMLRSAGVFVFPSLEEGWGIALAEAMAAGLPAVTYELPVFSEIFSGGRIGVPLGDTAAFANACAALFTNEDLRLKISDQATALSRSFTWEKAAQVEMSALLYLTRC